MHHSLTKEDIMEAKKKASDALVLVHPECKPEVTALADYVGSTSGIINFVSKSEADAFVVATEVGVMYQLKKNNPEKTFIPAGNMICHNMKKVTIERVLKVLENLEGQVSMDTELMVDAHKPMIRMLELAN